VASQAGPAIATPWASSGIPIRRRTDALFKAIFEQFAPRSEAYADAARLGGVRSPRLASRVFPLVRRPVWTMIR